MSSDLYKTERITTVKRTQVFIRSTIDVAGVNGSWDRNEFEIVAADRATLVAVLSEMKRLYESYLIAEREMPAPDLKAEARAAYHEPSPYADGPSKIMAVKRVRELSGLGLKEAKDFVDAMQADAELY